MSSKTGIFAILKFWLRACLCGSEVFTTHEAEDDILCTSARYLHATQCDAMSLLCWTVIYGANFQPCSNGMITGNNDIADTTACSVTYLR